MSPLTLRLLSDTNQLGDSVTRDARLIGTAQANSIVTLFDGDTVLAEIKADQTGAFSYAPNLADGSHLIKVRQQLGDTVETAQLALQLDTSAPMLTFFRINDSKNSDLPKDIQTGMTLINANALQDDIFLNVLSQGVETSSTLPLRGVVTFTSNAFDIDRTVFSVTPVVRAFPNNIVGDGIMTSAIRAGSALNTLFRQNVTDGIYTVHVNVSDLAGNLSEELTHSILVDLRADTGDAATLQLNGAELHTITKLSSAAVAFTVAGLDSDASAVARFTDGIHTKSVAIAANGDFTVDLSDFAGVVSSSLAITDVHMNKVSVSGNTVRALVSTGGVHDDVLAGGVDGNDTLTGGIGNDSYFVHHGNSIIFEERDEGFDVVYSYASKFHIGDNVEAIVLYGNGVQGTGNNGNNTLIGNSGNNILIGNDGFDTVVFEGNREAFSFVEGNHFYAVSGGEGGADELYTIERFVFGDITISDDGVGGNLSTATVELGETASGEIQFKGDRDWFRAELTAGNRYVINLQGTDPSAGTLDEPLARLRGADGQFIRSNDDGVSSFSTWLGFAPLTSGTYYIDIAAYNDAYLGAYTFRLEKIDVFQPAALKFGGFTSAEGWNSNDRYPRQLADVNGDSMADLVGFGESGVFVSLATGDGNFGPAALKFGGFTFAEGWNSDDRYPRQLADVNGDSMADLVGFGESGVFVSLATGDGNFGPAALEFSGFTSAEGWNSDDRYPRQLADVNGDSMADLVGFGESGVFVSLATGDGNFGPAALKFGGFTFAEGWNSDDRYPRQLADVDGDSMADLVGFGESGVFVSLATGDGNFGPAALEFSGFTSAEGWNSDDRYPRQLADVNGDSMADLVGFGESGVFVSLATGDGNFGPAALEFSGFTFVEGWNSDDRYPRQLADVNGDNTADIIGFGEAGVFGTLANQFFFV
ncbi:hypothetical protein [Methylorubrum extorquens]